MKIERMNKGNWGKVRAFFDLQTEEGFTIKGFKLVEGPSGYFVGFPSQKGNDDQYYDTVWADRELKDKVNQIAMKEYGGDIMTGGFEPPANSKSSYTGIDAPSDDSYSDDDIPF
ncbi:MAG: septation protein SpoVG family protein [Fidelibacterota bacterium]